MKNIIILSSLFALLVVTGCEETEKKAKETPRVSAATSTSSVKSEQNLNDAVKSLNYAIINPTQESLDAIVADELSYGHSSGKVQNKKEFIDDLLHGAYDFTSIDISDQQITMAGNTAMVRQIFDSEALNNGEPVHIHIGNMLIFQKQDGKWKLLGRQAFKI